LASGDSSFEEFDADVAPGGVPGASGEFDADVVPGGVPGATGGTLVFAGGRRVPLNKEPKCANVALAPLGAGVVLAGVGGGFAAVGEGLAGVGGEFA